MNEPLFNVLFLCTGNSSRSIPAESVLNHLGRGRFKAFSAGSHPTGVVSPLAQDALTRMKLPVAGLRSKSWDEFAAAGAPPLHFVFTVCDKAAGETCPLWPGQPITAHWGVEDPAAVVGSDEVRQAAFKSALRVLTRRIELFLNLPLEKLDRLALKEGSRSTISAGASSCFSACRFGASPSHRSGTNSTGSVGVESVVQERRRTVGPSRLPVQDHSLEHGRADLAMVECARFWL